MKTNSTKRFAWAAGCLFAGALALLTAPGCDGDRSDTAVGTKTDAAPGPAENDDGGGPIPDATQTDLYAGSAEIAAYAGVWTGMTSQKQTVSFILSEDGTLTDASMGVRLMYDDGGTCRATFVADKLVPIGAGHAQVTLRSALGNISLPLELDFRSATIAVSQHGGHSGAYSVVCNGEVANGTGQLVAPDTFTLRRVRGVSQPAADDRRVAGGSGSPIPLGNMDGACSQQPGSTHHVCAFARYGSLGEPQLWVVDLDQLAAGQGGCDPGTPSPACQMLTDHLYLVDYRAAASSEFQGDTLIFRAEGPVDGGTIANAYYFWRPGWTQPLLATGVPSSCEADPTSDAAVCRVNYRKTPQLSWYFDLLAGHLGDGKTPLPVAAHVLAVTSADGAAPSAHAIYQYGLSPGGAYLLWSARAEDAPVAKESLFALALGEPAANARMLAADVGRWSLSRDGKKLFLLAGIDRAVPGNPQPGRLEMANFPVPGAPVPIAAGLTSYYLEVAAAAGHQMVILTSAGDLLYASDLEGAPQTVRVLDRGVAAIRTWSPGAATVVYGKAVDSAGRWGDLFVTAPAAGKSCAADPDSTWLDPIASSTGRFVVAARAVFAPDPMFPTITFEWLDSTTCKSTKVADDADGWLRVGGDRFVIKANPMQLRKYGLAALGVLDPAARPTLSLLANDASGAVSVVDRDGTGAALDFLYAINAGWKTDGLYRRTVALPLP